MTANHLSLLCSGAHAHRIEKWLSGIAGTTEGFEE